jgi:NADPH2:quinone reductase
VHEPGRGEVRVRVAAAAVNPTDLWMRAGRSSKALADVPPPWVPGMDLAGTIDAVGQDVDFVVGERVMAVVIPLRVLGGAQAELVVVPAASVARLPAGLVAIEAATVPLNGLTARLALDRLALPRGATLGVTGAAGGLGGYAVQLAKLDGIRVVADASAADEALLAALGADVIVPREHGAAAFNAAVPAGLDAVLDCAVLGGDVLPAIRDDGQLAAIRAFREPAERGIAVRQIWISDYVTNQLALQTLADLAGNGDLTMRLAETLPPEHVADAHRRLEAGGVRGRLVLAFE